VSQADDSLGGAFLRLIVWRGFRNGVYWLLGIFRPSWRRALPLIRFRDRYADTGTMNMPLYSDPRFESNIRAIEVEIRRLRRGGASHPIRLPHDFPPGAQELLGSLVHRGQTPNDVVSPHN
jgi:hypothetical protein